MTHQVISKDVSYSVATLAPMELFPSVVERVFDYLASIGSNEALYEKGEEREGVESIRVFGGSMDIVGMVDGRAVVKCAGCRLTQFVARDERCRRCKSELVTAVDESALAAAELDLVAVDVEAKHRSTHNCRGAAA